MKKPAERMRHLLEKLDLQGFLSVFEKTPVIELAQGTELMFLTQNLLPSVLRTKLSQSQLTAQETIQLWSLVRSGRMILVENDLIEGINNLLDEASRQLHGEETTPIEKLQTFGEIPEYLKGRRPLKPPKDPLYSSVDIPMRRVVLTSTFTLGAVQFTDGASLRKNICASQQEREFTKAVRQYFPNMRAYPNYSLRNFIDLEGGFIRLSAKHYKYAWQAQVDILLCTEDEDPVAAFELDSVWHDSDEAGERDQLKDEIFQWANIPLIRIRPKDTENVRAEDFYDLLLEESEMLDRVRPLRMRPRRNHDMLIPARVDAEIMAMAI